MNNDCGRSSYDQYYTVLCELYQPSVSIAVVPHSPPSSFLVSVEDRVDRRAPLLAVPDSFTPLDPSPPREMVLMVKGFRSFCPSAKLLNR